MCRIFERYETHGVLQVIHNSVMGKPVSSCFFRLLLTLLEFPAKSEFLSFFWFVEFWLHLCAKLFLNALIAAHTFWWN